MENSTEDSLQTHAFALSIDIKVNTILPRGLKQFIKKGCISFCRIFEIREMIRSRGYAERFL